MSVYVLGAGGHAKVVVGTLLEAGETVAGTFDDDPRKKGQTVLGVDVLGTLREAGSVRGVAGVLAIGENRARRKLAESLPQWSWLTVIHPGAWVHRSVEVGPGTVVFAGAIIQPETRLGRHCIVNTGAVVDHDCLIEDYVHLAPGTHLGGGVAVEEGAFLGLGALVIPGVRVGAWSVVGAGAVVIADVPPAAKAAGVPAKVIGRVNP